MIEGHRDEPDPIVYKVDSPGVSPDALSALYTAVGWNTTGLRSAANCRKILRNSWCYVSAHHGDKLVGFSRVLADGVVGEIMDVVVLPDHRRRGIATAMMKTIMESVSDDLAALHLVDGSGFAQLYERFGFRPADPSTDALMYWEPPRTGSDR